MECPVQDEFRWVAMKMSEQTWGQEGKWSFGLDSSCNIMSEMQWFKVSILGAKTVVAGIASMVGIFAMEMI